MTVTTGPETWEKISCVIPFVLAVCSVWGENAVYDVTLYLGNEGPCHGL